MLRRDMLKSALAGLAAILIGKPTIGKGSSAFSAHSWATVLVSVATIKTQWADHASIPMAWLKTYGMVNRDEIAGIPPGCLLVSGIKCCRDINVYGEAVQRVQWTFVRRDRPWNTIKPAPYPEADLDALIPGIREMIGDPESVTMSVESSQVPIG